MDEKNVGSPLRPNKGLWIWWTDDRADYYKCSECGYGDEGEVKFGEGTDFCPCCGAEMSVLDINPCFGCLSRRN